MKKILILQGGFNEEHKVSLNSAREVAKALKKLKIHYEVLTVNPKTFKNDIQRYNKKYIFFNSLHGSFGEDGEIQEILQKKKFKYTHSTIKSSFNCFNKIKSKQILNKYKILTPLYLVISCEKLTTAYLNMVKKKFKNFVIKPVCSGSSFGLKVIKSKKDLLSLCNNLKFYKKNFKSFENFIIEKYISGKELTVSIIEKNSIPKPLEVTEIVSFNKIYDYQAKYIKGFSKHYIPARITKLNYKKCLNLALKIHKIFKCTSISRIDFIYNKKENKIYFLEINSQPGMTKLSLLPEQAKYLNITFESIILNLINNAL